MSRGDTRSPGRPGPSTPAEQGPGRWNRESGSRPSTTTSNPPPRRDPKAS